MRLGTYVIATYGARLHSRLEQRALQLHSSPRIGYPSRKGLSLLHLTCKAPSHSPRPALRIVRTTTQLACSQLCVHCTCQSSTATTSPANPWILIRSPPSQNISPLRFEKLFHIVPQHFSSQLARTADRTDDPSIRLFQRKQSQLKPNHSRPKSAKQTKITRLLSTGYCPLDKSLKASWSTSATPSNSGPISGIRPTATRRRGCCRRTHWRPSV